MNKIQIAKAVTNFVVGVGTSQIVASVVKNNVATENVPQQVAVFAGRVVLASMVGEAAEKHTSAKIDSAVDWYNQNFKNA